MKEINSYLELPYTKVIQTEKDEASLLYIGMYQEIKVKE